jgi:hypothetical protein
MPLTDKQAIVARLVAQYQYPMEGAQIVAEKLINLHPTLASQAADWWDSGVPVAISAEGLTVQSLMEQRGLNPVAAILTLDWLLREPEKARLAISKGHDRVR